MSVTESKVKKRFNIPNADSDGIAEKVDELIDEGHRIVLDEANEWRWTIRTLPVEEITRDEDLAPKRNAAQRERSRAIARTKLTMCEASPLVVITDENALLSGHARLDYLKELGESYAVVYHGTPK